MRNAARHVATNAVEAHRGLLVGRKRAARRYTLLGLLILIAGTSSFGQSLSVTGTVADSASGTPIEFA